MLVFVDFNPNDILYPLRDRSIAADTCSGLSATGNNDSRSVRCDEHSLSFDHTCTWYSGVAPLLRLSILRAVDVQTVSNCYRPGILSEQLVFEVSCDIVLKQILFEMDHFSCFYPSNYRLYFDFLVSTFEFG